MDDFFFVSDPLIDYYNRLSRPPSPADIPRRPFMTPVTSPPRPQRRPVASRAPTTTSLPNPTPAPAPAPAPAPKPRVVSIPIHYGDDRRASASSRVLRPSEAATRIQRVFRGFSVRRMVEKVSGIAEEIHAIEEMMASRAEREKIRSDPGEKMRVGEMLMRLLLRLDSVLGIRDYRRKVIRRVIRMQEMVDSIPSAAQTPDTPTEIAEEIVKEERSDEQPPSGMTTDVDLADDEVEARKMEVHVEGSDDDDEFVVLSMDEELSSSSPKVAEPEEVMRRSNPHNDFLVPTPAEPTEAATAAAMVEENSRAGAEIKGVVEKLMAENEELQQLVATLCDQSAQQCQLISGLLSRVGNMEQALQEIESKKRPRQWYSASHNGGMSQ